MEHDHIPEEIIERIQFFLDGKEAAHTALLSKSWHSVWNARPDLDFDQRHFQSRSADEMLELAKNTMQRYEDLERKIKSFRLLMVSERRKDDLQSRRHLLLASELHLLLAEELMAKAVKLGAVGLDITLCNPDSVLVVPRSETLATLSLTGPVTIDLQNLTCPILKSLSLSNVAVPSDLTDAPFSRFPCLKELVVSDWLFPSDTRICSTSLERISIDFQDRWIDVEFDVPNIRKFKIEGCSSCRIAFKTTTTGREWESRVHLTCCNLNVPWFMSLNQILDKLSHSKLSLFINIRFRMLELGKETKVSLRPPKAGLPSLPLVECLTLEGYEVTPCFLDILFLYCRPKIIIQHCSDHEAMDRYLLELVSKRVVEEVSSEVIFQERVRLRLGWRK